MVVTKGLYVGKDALIFLWAGMGGLVTDGQVESCGSDHDGGASI